ncbi:MAG: hypothetical protein WAL59_31225 [Roseiarcus sp.]
MTIAVDFDFDLDEIVRFGNRDVSLRRALREYIETKKQLMGGVIGPPMWLRDWGKKPSSFNASHMDALGGSIAAEDLKRGGVEFIPENGEGPGVRLRKHKGRADGASALT